SYKYQGLFTEGTLLFEAVNDGRGRYHRAQRTTSLTFPFTLQKAVTTNKDGLSSITENRDWDLMTGAVLETKKTSPLGVVTQNITVPAYKLYAEFGSKADNPANKNMLTQNAANYTYRLDNFGNRTGLLSASVTTWKKDWNYRVLDTNGNYVND